jgi:hypothetical protein
MSREFMDALIAEEQRIDHISSTSNYRKQQLSIIIKESWMVGGFWYTLALASPHWTFCMFYKQI